MGQKVSIENNQIQTSIDIFIQEIIEGKYSCKDMKEKNIIYEIKSYLEKLLKNMTHNQLIILSNMINNNKLNNTTTINIDTIIKYYIKKITLIVCIYGERENLIKKMNIIKENKLVDIKNLNNIVKIIHYNDTISQKLVEEFMHNITMTNGKIKRMKYFREIKISNTELNKLIKKYTK
jgi:hypothetical protein